MNLQRQEEIRIIAECPNDMHWAQEMRRAVAELLAHIDTLEQAAAERVIVDGSRGPVEAPAVVVPEMDAPTICGLIETYVDDPREIDGVSTAQAVMRWFRENSRVIPADRVLGEGMVEELRLLRDALVELCDSQLSSRDREGAIARGLAALRANQGGANE